MLVLTSNDIGNIQQLVRDEPMFAMQVDETKTKKHPNPVHGIVHIRKTMVAMIDDGQDTHNNTSSTIAAAMAVRCPAMLVDWVQPTHNSLIYKRHNLEQNIILEIEVTVKAEGDVCPVCFSPVYTCGCNGKTPPLLKAAKCYMDARERALPLLRFEFAEAAVQPQDSLRVCARLRLVDSATSTLLLDEAVVSTTVKLLQKLP